jgi:hypothetical protein
MRARRKRSHNPAQQRTFQLEVNRRKQMNPQEKVRRSVAAALLLCTGLNLTGVARSVAAEAHPARHDLERIAYAVAGVESSYGRNPAMWRPNLAGPQGPMQVSEKAARDVGGGDRFDVTQNRTIGRAYLALLYRRYVTGPTPSRPIIGEWAISTVGSGRGDPHENWRQPSRITRTGSYSTPDYAPVPAATVCPMSRVALRRIAGSATAAPAQHPHPTFG